MFPLAMLLAARKARGFEPGDDRGLEPFQFPDNPFPLMGDQRDMTPIPTMGYRDPMQAGPAPPVMGPLSSMYGGRR